MKLPLCKREYRHLRRHVPHWLHHSSRLRSIRQEVHNDQNLDASVLRIAPRREMIPFSELRRQCLSNGSRGSENCVVHISHDTCSSRMRGKVLRSPTFVADSAVAKCSSRATIFIVLLLVDGESDRFRVDT